MLAQRANARAALERARAGHDATEVAELEPTITELSRAIEERLEKAAELRRQADGLRATALGGEGGFDLLDEQMPLLLLPVRLETRRAWSTPEGWRFTSQMGGDLHLLVRVHPDEIHANGHEPQLTVTEAEWARRFVEAAPPGTDFADALPHWSQLVANAGTARAAWLRAAGLKPPDPLLRPGVWSRPVTAALMPDHWVIEVTCRDTDQLVRARGDRVREPLDLTPDPRGTNPVAGAAPGGPGIAWMTDFTAAQQHGMAVAVPLPAPTTEVRRVVAIGVRGSLDATASSDELEQVLAGHRYTRGVALPAPGAATTSVAPARAAFSTTEPPSASLLRELSVLSTDGDGSNGARLGEALGIGATTFAHVDRAGESDARDEGAFRELLAIALRRPLGALLGPAVPDAWLDEMLPIFVADVRALGPFPALRIGSQPYGVLPVSLLFDRVGQAGNQDRPLAFAETLRAAWWDSAVERVPRIRSGLADPGRTFVDALQAEGTTRQVRLRTVLGGQLADAVLVTNVQRLVRGQLRQTAKAELDALLGQDSGLAPLLQFVLAPGAATLSVPLVAGEEGTADDPANYLQRLLTTSLDELAASGDQPSPLLYHLCRAALLEQADIAAIRLAIQGGTTTAENIPPWERDLATGDDENFWTWAERLGTSLPGETRTLGRLLHEDTTSLFSAGVRNVRRLITGLTFVEPERLRGAPARGARPDLPPSRRLVHRHGVAPARRPTDDAAPRDRCRPTAGDQRGRVRGPGRVPPAAGALGHRRAGRLCPTWQRRMGARAVARPRRYRSGAALRPPLAGGRCRGAHLGDRPLEPPGKDGAKPARRPAAGPAAPGTARLSRGTGSCLPSAPAVDRSAPSARPACGRKTHSGSRTRRRSGGDQRGRRARAPFPRGASRCRP